MIDREKVRTDLIHQAIKAFSENSYKNTKLTDIGRKCGVSTTVIYSYYGSKEKLFNVCVDYVLTTLKEKILEPVFQQSPTLRDFIINYINFTEENSDMWRLEGNFYVMLSSNNWEIEKVQSFIRNFEQNLFNYYAAYLKQVTTSDRYWLLMIDSVLHTYIFASMNDFYRRKMMMYTSLYEVGLESRKAEFKKNFLADLDVWLEQLSSLQTLDHPAASENN